MKNFLIIYLIICLYYFCSEFYKTYKQPTVDKDEMTDTITKFCEEHYPKGHKDRGKAILILTLFLMWWKK